MFSVLRQSLRTRVSLLALVIVPVVVAQLLASTVNAQDVPQTDEEKAFYSIGVSIAAQLEMVKPIGPRELDILIQGVRDAVGDQTLAVEEKEGAALVRNLLQERKTHAAEFEEKAAADFLAAEAKKKGARTTESGLIYTEIRAGKGAQPSATDKVRVHYHGTLRDGTVFDSSVDRGTPAEFALNRVIPCWTEGVAMMTEGGKSRLVCPAAIAYGDKGAGRILPGAALSFEVELIEIK